jgi:tRNA pseudouridine38-40 synthase
MVRFLVGTMVDISLGRRPVEEMRALLASTDNQDTSPPAPPQGLFFEAADYPAELFVDPDRPPYGLRNGSLTWGDSPP